MNLVLDEAEEVFPKKKTRKQLGVYKPLILHTEMKQNLAIDVGLNQWSLLGLTVSKLQHLNTFLMCTGSRRIYVLCFSSCLLGFHLQHAYSSIKSSVTEAVYVVQDAFFWRAIVLHSCKHCKDLCFKLWCIANILECISMLLLNLSDWGCICSLHPEMFAIAW